MTEKISERAFLLHKKPISDHTNYLTVLTLEHGLLRGYLKKSKAHELTPFAPLWLRFKSKPTYENFLNYEVLSQSYHYPNKALFCAIYLNELLVKLARENQTNSTIFYAYEHCLENLSQNQNIELSLRQFELCLLKEMGYSLSYHLDANTGEAITKHGHYKLYVEVGFVRVEQSQNASHEALLSGEDLLAIHQGDYNSSALKSLKLIMRTMIHHLLQGRTLKSRALFEKTTHTD